MTSLNPFLTAQYFRIMLLIIWLLVLTPLALCQPPPTPTLLQMSMTNQTLYIPLPYFSNASIETNLSNSTGGVKLQFSANRTYSLNSSQILDLEHYYGDIAFWAQTEQGISLFYLEHVMTENYTGIILYNNPAINTQQRTVILFNVTQGKDLLPYLQFDVAAPDIDPINKTLTLNIYSSQLFNFSNASLNYELFKCKNITILYVGANNFTYFCDGSSYFALFTIPDYEIPGPVTYPAIIFDNVALNISQPLNISDAVVNPQLFFGANNYQLLWTIIFASENTAYICNILNFSQGSLLDCGSIAQFQGQVINLMSMLGNYFVPYTGVATETGIFILQNQQAMRFVTNLTHSNYVFLTDEYVYVEVFQDYNDTASNSTLYIYNRQTSEFAGQLSLNGMIFVVENDLIISHSNGTVNFLVFEPTYMIINSQAAQTFCPSTNTTCSIQFQIKITATALDNSTTTYQLLYQLFIVPINQTFFTVENMNDNFDIYAINDRVIVGLGQYQQVIGPLVNATVSTNYLGQFIANITDSQGYEFNLSNIQQVINSPQTNNLYDSQLYSYTNKSITSYNPSGVEKSYLPCTNNTLLKLHIQGKLMVMADELGNFCRCTLTRSCKVVFRDPNVIRQSMVEIQIVGSMMFASVITNNSWSLWVDTPQTKPRKLDVKYDDPPIYVNISLAQINRGRIAALLPNNSILMFTVNLTANDTSLSPQPNYLIPTSCPSGNYSSQMVLQPTTNILIFYCYSSPFLHQYIINNTGPTSKRLIPLYNFVTSSSAWLKGSMQFYFVPVLLVSQLWPYVIGTNYTIAMQYDQPTSATMKKIVNSTQILVDVHMDGVFYASNNTTGVLQYFGREILLQVYVNTQQNSCKNCSAPVYIGLSSPFNYNNLHIYTVWFNLSQAWITYNLPPSPISKQNYDTPCDNMSMMCFYLPTPNNVTLHQQHTPYYYAEFFFNFTLLTGTVQNFKVTSIKNTSVLEMGTAMIHQIDLVEPNKLVGSIGNRFTSLLSLDIVDYTILTNTTLTNLIIGINEETIVVMEKIGTDQNNNSLDLNPLNPPIPLPQPLDTEYTEYCKVHLYSVINQTAADFLLSCGVTQITTIGYPYTLITINYVPGAAQPLNYSHDITFLPSLLQAISSVPTNITSQSPYVFGLTPESGNTASTRLIICNQSNSSFLANTLGWITYVILDYDLLPAYPNYLVAVLDLFGLTFWYNPIPNTTAISPSFNISVLYLTQLTGEEAFSFVDIVGMTTQQVSIVLGGELSYYLMTFELEDIPGTIYVEYVFQKYYQCNDQDQFKPQYVFKSQQPSGEFLGSDISMMAIYCEENKTILSFEKYQNHKNVSSSGIYTSYVQIFSTVKPNSSLPVSVLPADTTDVSCILTVYDGQQYNLVTDPFPNTTASQNSTVKLIYQQISGILIDNRLKNITGFIVIYESPEPTQLPSFKIVFNNSYFNYNITINSSYLTPLKPPPFNWTVLPYIILFLLFNVVTVGMIILWCYRNRRKNIDVELIEPKSESDDGELKAYYDRLYKESKQRGRERDRVFELEQFQ